MGVVSITVNDKKSVTIEYEDGRKVKYLYNHLLSENAEANCAGVQMELKIQEPEPLMVSTRARNFALSV